MMWDKWEPKRAERKTTIRVGKGNYALMYVNFASSKMVPLSIAYEQITMAYRMGDKVIREVHGEAEIIYTIYDSTHPKEKLFSEKIHDFSRWIDKTNPDTYSPEALFHAHNALQEAIALYAGDRERFEVSAEMLKANWGSLVFRATHINNGPRINIPNSVAVIFLMSFDEIVELFSKENNND